MLVRGVNTTSRSPNKYVKTNWPEDEDTVFSITLFRNQKGRVSEEKLLAEQRAIKLGFMKQSVKLKCSN